MASRVDLEAKQQLVLPILMTRQDLQADHDWVTLEFYRPWRIVRRVMRHIRRPGGLKTATLRQRMAKAPEEVIRKAIKGMLPRGPLGRQMLRKLHVYAETDHPHQAQQPKPRELDS